MAPDKHKEPLGNEGQLSLASPSNAIVASSDRPIRLENALKAFRDVLTDEERERLRGEMAVSRDAGQVIAFTAGLDLVDPHRRGKSIATRLHSILQTVLQFSQVVDTYVSSHPQIAALVWGSVRLAFTVLANFTSFFQTFSDLLNGFDTLTPQFKEYQILFPDSLPLRNSVYDFHSAIISCCTQVISSTRRTWSQQAWASLTSSFDSEIRPRVTEIREKAELVKGQAALAKAQDDSRRQAKLAAELQLREKEREWSSLLLKLFPYDHQSEFIHARGKIHRGTAEWVFGSDEFRDWYESADSSTLNISGKIGSGKTILTANVISHLLQKLPLSCSVSYIFIRFDDEKSRLVDMILRSIIYQTLTGCAVQDSLMVLLKNSASNSFERGSLLLLLNHSISLLDKTFLIVDGLDQCFLHEQHALLQCFSQIIKMANEHGSVKILLSGRESMAKDVDRALAPTKRLQMGLADTNADLSRYIEEILAEKRHRGELVVRDETIMNQIVNRLQVGGEGMFLWVFLTIEDICSCPTDDDIRQTLEILPSKLSDTFNRALERIQTSQSFSTVDLVQRTFGWVATVRRPMTRWELGEALGVKVLQKSSIKGRIINGTERLPSWCENLVQIEAGDETVRFFHHSIKTRLLDVKFNAETPELAAFFVDLEAWDHHIGEICLTYLNFSDFQRALADFSPETNSLHARQIASSSVGRNVPTAVGNQVILNALSKTWWAVAARFLRRLLKPKKFGERFQVPKGVSKSEDGPEFSEFISGYPFLLYATSFWFHHTSHFPQSTTKTWNLWKEQVQASILEDDTSWADFGQLPPGFHAATIDLNSWRSGESIRDPDKSELKGSKNKKRDAKRILLHKAIIFADFNAHRALLAHVLTAIKDHDHNNLSVDVLELLLPTRRVFQSPLKHEGYIGDENSHDGLVSLITEFIAWGGTAWPRTLSLRFSCKNTCRGKPLHEYLIKIISESGYSIDDDTGLQLLATIAVLKFTKEAAKAIETWIKLKKPCIHEIRTRNGGDLIDFILEIGGSSSLGFARVVVDLHENCTGVHTDRFDECRHKLKRAILGSNTDVIDFCLQISHAELEKERKYRGIDFDLLKEIAACRSLPRDLRRQVISIAIPGFTKRELLFEGERLREFIVYGHWDVVVALSIHGIKFAKSVSQAGRKRLWLEVLDNVLCCVAKPATSSCNLIWAALNESTINLCASHISEAMQAWAKPYPPSAIYEEEFFESLYSLVYSVEDPHPLRRAKI